MLTFVHENMSLKDVQEMIGTEDTSDFIKINDMTRLEHIAVDNFRIFPSLSRARKNGWGGEIPDGFLEWKRGKRKFITLKPFGELSEFFTGQELVENIKAHKELFWK